MHKIGTMKWYCLEVLVIVMLFVLMWYFFPDRVFHLHHYTIAIILQTFLCNQELVTTALHAYANGVFIEGGASWGYDPTWRLPNVGASRSTLRSKNKKSEVKTVKEEEIVLIVLD